MALSKVEVKNLNSFQAMRLAVQYEFNRQVAAIDAMGGDPSAITQETRTWDESRQETKSMRTKEGAADYRYVREPDLPFLRLASETIDALEASMPELPVACRKR